MFPVIQIGPLAVQAPGLILLVALWLGLNASEKIAPRKGLTGDILYTLVFISLVTGVIFARLAFILAHFDAFTKNWSSIFALDPHLLDPWVGTSVTLLTALVISRRAKLQLWVTLDTLTPFFAVMVVGAWLAALSAGTAFGRETTLPWGIQLWGVTRHPTQVYGLLGALLTLGFLPRINVHADGLRFLHLAAFSAATLLIVEGFRADSLMIGNFRLMQIAAWAILAFAFFLIDKISRPAPR